MGVFVVLIIVPMMIQHFYTRRQKINFDKKNEWAMFLFFAILTLLVMLRHETVGNDTKNYIYFFSDISKKNWGDLHNESFEIGFAFLNKFVSIFTSNQQIYIALIAVVTSLMIYPTYRRLCIDPSLTIVLFCTMSTFLMMFSGIRQMLAIGIGFIAYEFTRNKKVIPFLIVVCIAMTLHVSAFMLFFMYPIYYARITRKRLFVVVPVLCVIFVFNNYVFSFLTMIVSRYTKYENALSSTGAYTMLVLFVIFAVFAFIIPNDSKIDEETIGLRNFLLFAIVMQMFVPLHNLAMRMNYYYIIFIPLLLPKVIACKSERLKQVAVIGRHVMVIFFLFYFFISKVLNDNNLNVFPYHFFWESI